MKNNTLLYVFIAMILAGIAGLLTGQTGTVFGVPYLEIYSLIGQLFLNALTLVVVPLVAASIITGTARIACEHSFGSLGLKTFSLYFLTSALAVMCAWFVSVLLEPGIKEHIPNSAMVSGTEALQEIQKNQGDVFDTIRQIFLKLVPSNILAVASQGQMLGLILFSLLFGFFIPKIDAEAGKALLGFWKGIFEVMMCMTHLVMKALPLGVFGLVAKVVATTGFSALKPIAFFFVTVFCAFGIYCFIVLPLLLKLMGGINPLKHYKAVSPALFTAFSTSSSAAALPVTIDCVERRAGVSNRICSFTVPLAISLNLSGTALYSCVSVFFICQVYGLQPGWGMQFLIALLALLTSIGMAGIPSASIAAIIMILQTIGLPADGIVMIMAVERILDMFRTGINVLGHTCCAVLVAKSEGEHVSEF